MEFRSGKVLVDSIHAGRISETESGYRFEYAPGYLALGNPLPVSLTMPLRPDPYVSKVLFPFSTD